MQLKVSIHFSNASKSQSLLDHGDDHDIISEFQKKKSAYWLYEITSQHIHVADKGNNFLWKVDVF